MALAIISNNNQISNQLQSILAHYFSSPNTEKNREQLYVKTKYYECFVPLIKCNHMHSQLNSKEEQNVHKILQNEASSKIDFIIFLFRKDEQVTNISELIDSTINKYEAQSYIICVHDEFPEVERQNLGISNWKYKDEVLDCENFITIICQNLFRVNKNLPEWKQGGLLQQNDQQCQIFSIFQLIQTTAWTNSQNTKSLQSMSKQGYISSDGEDEAQQKPQKGQEKKLTSSADAKTQQTKNEEQINEQEQKKLQKEMMEFEMLMQQMMSLKHTPGSGNSKKAKAQELIFRLANNMEF